MATLHAVTVVMLLMVMVRDLKMSPVPAFAITKCIDIDRPLPDTEMEMLQEGIKKLEKLFLQLSQGKPIICGYKVNETTFEMKDPERKIKNTDYQLILLVRAFFDRLRSMSSEAMATSYVTGDDTRWKRVVEVLDLLCGLHSVLDGEIESYEDQCAAYQKKPVIDMSKFFHVFDLSLKTKPYCLIGRGENTVATQVRLMFKQAEMICTRLYIVLQSRRTVHLKYSFNKSKNIVIG